MLSFSYAWLHSPFEWTHPSWLAMVSTPVAFKLHGLKLACTKILVLGLYISQRKMSTSMWWCEKSLSLYRISKEQNHYLLAYSSLFELSERNFLAKTLYIKSGIGLYAFK